jgi:large-conductance mechanosensitive channel
MSAIHAAFIQAKATNRSDLRKFGVVFACILAGIFYGLLPWLTSGNRSAFVLAVSTALFCVALIIPVALRPLYVVATIFGTVMGAINNRIILSLIFFLVFTPMALLMRTVNKSDPMRAKFEPQAKSYRVLRENKDLVKNKEKAF